MIGYEFNRRVAAPLAVVTGVGLAACSPSERPGPAPTTAAVDCETAFSAPVQGTDEIISWADFEVEDPENPRFILDIADQDMSGPQIHEEPDFPVPRPRSADLAGNNGPEAQDAAWESVEAASRCYDQKNTEGILTGLWVRESYENGNEAQIEEAERRVGEIAAEAFERFETPENDENGGPRSVVGVNDNETPIQLMYFEPYFGPRPPAQPSDN